MKIILQTPHSDNLGHAYGSGFLGLLLVIGIILLFFTQEKLIRQAAENIKDLSIHDAAFSMPAIELFLAMALQTDQNQEISNQIVPK